MGATCLRYFAVRLGDYVEVRSSCHLPIPKVSKLVRIVHSTNKTYKYFAEPPYVKLVSKPVESKITLKQTTYTGGRVLGVCKYLRFYGVGKRFGVGTLAKDKLVEIPKELRRALAGSFL